ncbi:MAG: hypothetical protein KTR33_16650 [Gammaproteobacteria bacterium]|nr:hypothetical protein [Gammaproteobacteria bacterium]
MLKFRTLRITLLLGGLICASLVTAHQMVYTRSWTKPLDVVIYPINADGHLATDKYIQSLSTSTFAQIDRWMEREAERHNLALTTPVNVTLGGQIQQHPPAFPVNGNAVDVLFWGLSFRYWAWRNTPESESDLTRVRLFVMYHEGEEDKPLAHSLGMQKGLMGLVHAFALDKQTNQNNIVIAHEMLHTVGALDKYERTGAPMFPVGYANPARTPLFPQRSAEIMAGRIPVSHYSHYMAESLKSVVLNEYTAAEINWLEE